MLDIDYLEKLKEIGKPQKAEDEKVEFLRGRGELLAQVFEEEIRQPSFNVVIYALSHETLFLKNVISVFNNLKDKNDLSPYYIERMDPRELFRSLRLLESDCLWTLFEKIKDQPIMVVEGLKNAVLNNNIEAFLTILSEKSVDTEPITPICRLLYIKVRMDDLQEWMDEIEKHGFRASNKDELNKTAINSLLQYTIEQNQIIQDLCITKFRDNISAYQHEQMERNIIESSSFMDIDLVSKPEYLVETLVGGIKKEEPTFKGETLTADDFAVLQYKNFIRLYCKFLSRFPDISTCAITVIEGLIKNEAFRHVWSHYETFDEKTEDEIENDMEGFLKKHSVPIDEDSQEEDEIPTTPQIEEPQSSKSPAEIEAQKEAERKSKEVEAFNLIKELLANTAGEKDFFKDGFTLEHLETFFKIILTDKRVLEAMTKTDKRMIYVYKGIVLEKFCNIIGYLIKKGVISESQKEVAEALFGMEETKTAIFNWKPVDKNSREAVDRKVNIFTTLSSYISNGVNDNSKSFINPKIREWFDATLNSIRHPQ